MAELINNFPDFLRDLMKRAGISQSQLARRSGVAQPTINRILNGNVVDYRVETIKSLAKGLQIGTDVLIAAVSDAGSRAYTNDTFRIYADRFDGQELEDTEWQFLETNFKDMVDRFKADKLARRRMIDNLMKKAKNPKKNE